MEHLKDNGNLIERGTERIPFDVTFTKGDIKAGDMFFANEFSYLVDRQTPDQQRSELIEQAISAIKEPILGQAVKVFGRDLSDVEIKIKPNFHDLVDDEKIINNYMEKVESYYEDQPHEIIKHREHAKAALNHHKSELPEFFPGYEKEIVPNVCNTEIEEAVQKATWHYGTIAIAEEAQKDINDIIWGYELTHDVKANERAYFIVMERADGKEAIVPLKLNKVVSAEDQMSQESQIVSETRQFVYDNTRNLEDLNNLSVRVEEARGLSYISQQEYYQEIGMNQLGRKEYAGSLNTYFPHHILSKYELNIVPFDVEFKKDSQCIKESVKEIKPDRIDKFIDALKHKVIERAYESFGKDVIGLEVNMQPNYDSYGTILESRGTSVADMIKNEREVENAMKDANKQINNILKGYETTHSIKSDEQAFFIVMNKADVQEKVKTIAVDKSLPLEGQKLLIKNEARDFVLENVKNRSQLTDISLRAEKANDLSDTNQQKFYQEIGRQENSMSMQNQVEMSK